MRSYDLAAIFATAAMTSPVKRQDLDWDAIEALDSLPTPSIPVVNAEAAQTTLAFEPTAAASAVASAVLAAPSDTVIERRDGEGEEDPIQAVCTVYKPACDTPEYFRNTHNFTSAATSAQTPDGYELVYQNQNGSSIGVFGYMGYSILDLYDAQECSKRCDAVTGCQSFNIYFERDPAEEPRANCTNPASETVIKCVYYGGPVTQASATNDGQWREDFHVLIAGSNGYVNHSITTPEGYNAAVPLGNAAIHAFNDCNGHYTYMGVKIFQEGVFSVDKCAAACSATSDYHRAHPDANGDFQTCQFFNTYVLYNSSVAVGQYCALYNETWQAGHATNVGQWRGEDYFSIEYSYAFSNSTGNADQPQGCTNSAGPQ